MEVFDSRRFFVVSHYGHALQVASVEEFLQEQGILSFRYDNQWEVGITHAVFVFEAWEMGDHLRNLGETIQDLYEGIKIIPFFVTSDFETRLEDILKDEVSADFPSVAVAA